MDFDLTPVITYIKDYLPTVLLLWATYTLLRGTAYISPTHALARSAYSATLAFLAIALMFVWS